MNDLEPGQLARRNARRLAVNTAAATAAIQRTDRARRALERLASSMTETVQALRSAHETNAHTALGYDTWEDYCAAEFASVRSTRIAIPDRVEIVAALTAVGMPASDVGSALGVSASTVNRDVERGQADGGGALPRQAPGHRYTDPGAAAGRQVVAGTVLREKAARRPTMPWPGQHFGTHHDVYRAAADRCRDRGHQNTDAYGACGPCWEATIRADERRPA